MEDLSYLGMLKIFAPKVPSILGATALHTLSFTQTASIWDFRTAVTMATLRSFLNLKTPSPVSRAQRLSLRDEGPKGRLWVAPVVIPAPHSPGPRDAIVDAIAAMGDGSEVYTKPEGVRLRAEWTGFRSEATSAEERLPAGLTPEQSYDRLMKDPNRTSNVTILYFHGGAYYMCGFGTHRLPVSKLAKACQGRALAVEYRLAPQSAFPAQLVDALNAYLYLLYPPDGALHQPVPANEIVFAGDSAGGNLAFALLQLILHFHRSSPDSTPKIQYEGRSVEVPMPAAVGSMSPWLDIARACPSLYTNQPYDYLPPPFHDAPVNYPKEDIWPTEPPRGDLFCDLSLIAHPLVSPLTATDWSRSPPLYITVGDETLYDECAVVATRAREQGVTVQWEHHEAMPHCFSLVLTHLDTSEHIFQALGRFARDAVHGSVEPKTVFVRVKTAKQDQVKLEIGDQAPFSWETAVKYVKDAQRRKQAGFPRTPAEKAGVPALAQSSL